jgi:DNA repair protein RadC
MARHLPPITSSAFFGSLEQASKYLSRIGEFDQECGVLVTLDKGCFKIKEHLLSLGKMHKDQTDLRILFNRIILDKASCFLFAHNHPNGMAVFSPSDYEFTIGVLYLSAVLEVKFLDHILFAHGRKPVSMARKYPILFDKDWMVNFKTDVHRYTK